MTVTDTGLGTIWGTPAAGQYYLTALARDWFVPEVQDTRNNANPILGLIPSKSMDVGGKFIRIPVIFGRNYSAFNFVREGGKMPDPGTTQAWQYAFRPRKLFMRLVADGDLIEATEPESSRYIEYYEFMAKPVQEDLAVDFGRILHNDGSGRIAEVDANQAGIGADEVRLRLNSSWESVATCESSPAQYLEAGRRVGFYSNIGGHRGTRDVVSIVSETPGPPSTAVVKFNAIGALGNIRLSLALATGDWIVASSRDDIADTLGGSGATGEAISSGYRTEPMGLRGIFSDAGVIDGHGLVTLAGTYDLAANDDFVSAGGSGGFQGIPTSGPIGAGLVDVPPFNRAPIFANGGVPRSVNENMLQPILSNIEDRNNAQVTMLLSHSSVHDAYGQTLTPDKRYHNTLELKGGWKVADFKGLPWYRDLRCPKNILYMLALESAGFCQYVQTPFKPVMAYGQHWYRLPDDELYHAAWKMSLNLGVGCRDRAGGLITDLIGAAV